MGTTHQGTRRARVEASPDSCTVNEGVQLAAVIALGGQRNITNESHGQRFPEALIQRAHPLPTFV